MYRTRVGVDLAKEVIQVCIYRNKKVQSNIEMTPSEFLCWLVNAKPVTIIFEACGTSNYWRQKAIEVGHDALAIVQTSLLPDVTFIGGKTVQI
ncbi:MAG: transposase [Cognaticolwellia sp.]|jgi:transposase